MNNRGLFKTDGRKQSPLKSLTFQTNQRQTKTMLDNALIGLIASTLDAASAAAGWHYPVIQKNQPTPQGIPYEPAIFLEKLFDRHYGYPILDYEYQSSGSAFQTSETQIVETTFQISSFTIQDPSDTTLPTAADVANYLKQYLSSRTRIYSFYSQGVAILRVTEIRNPYFHDDRERYEANPSFDFVCIHSREFIDTVPACDTVIGEIVAGFEGQGVFPVPDNQS